MFVQTVNDRLIDELYAAFGTAPSAELFWTPNPGPQTWALESEADELLFGGAAGGGKTDATLGLASTQHQESVIFRREYRQLTALIARSKELFEARADYNHTDRVWRFSDGRRLEFGAMEREDDWRSWQGRPHDLLAFDELTHFTRLQYTMLTAWCRTTIPGQRTRVFAGTNPPLGDDPNDVGLWIVDYWSPWLDETHPHPAKPGELRWFVRIDGQDRMVTNGRPINYQGATLYPRSRTFIPSRLENNPYLLHDTQYLAVLQSLPDVIQAALLDGSFAAARQDNPWQVIPTAWIKQAQERWHKNRPGAGNPVPLTRVGVDVAEGGPDRTVFAYRYGDWIAEPQIYRGKATPNSFVTADLVCRAVASSGWAVIDANGVGLRVYRICRGRKARAQAFVGSGRTKKRDRSGRYSFVNHRAAAWWALREALDPENGPCRLALPPGQEVIHELSAPRFLVEGDYIKLEKKEKIIERLGRSPDIGDAIVMANYDDEQMLMEGIIGRTTTKIEFGRPPTPLSSLPPDQQDDPKLMTRTTRFGGNGNGSH